MSKHLFGLVSAAALFLGLAGTAQAQQSIACSPEMIALLGFDPNPGNGGEGCEIWRSGLGESTSELPANPNSTYTEFRNSPIPGAMACGPEGIPDEAISGTVVFEEPKASVCDPATTAAGCPTRLYGNGPAGADQVNRSVFVTASLLSLPFLIGINAQAVSFEGTVGTRYACDAVGAPIVNMNSTFDECSATTPGKTFIQFSSDSPLINGTGTPDTNMLVYQNLNGVGDNVNSGSAFCCFDGGANGCEDIASFADYPSLNRPLRVQFAGYRSSPPWVFDGGRGTEWIASQTWVLPGQEHGVCFQDRNTPCTATGNECTAPDVCDLSDRGTRPGSRTTLPDGNPNPAFCAAGAVRWQGEAVDVGGTGVSSFCWLPTFYGDTTFGITPPEGDPVEGCLLKNFGVYSLPDFDCDGNWDDTNNSGQPGPDKCPGWSELDPFADTNADGIGDGCQCADGNRDGAVTGIDIGAAALCANGAFLPQCDETILDADGDIATTGLDIGGIVAVVNGNAQTSALQCGRNP